jgi:hypothetical protein
MKNIVLAFLLSASYANVHGMDINSIEKQKLIHTNNATEQNQNQALLEKFRSDRQDEQKRFGLCVVGTCFCTVAFFATMAILASVYEGDYGISSSYSSNS